MSCTDVSVVPHCCIDIRETFFSDCFGNWRIARSEEYREELSSCDIVFCSVAPVSVSIGESLVLEIFDRFLIPRVLCISKCSESFIETRGKYKKHEDDVFCRFHDCTVPIFPIIQPLSVKVV